MYINRKTTTTNNNNCYEHERSNVKPQSSDTLVNCEVCPFFPEKISASPKILFCNHAIFRQKYTPFHFCNYLFIYYVYTFIVPGPKAPEIWK